MLHRDMKDIKIQIKLLNRKTTMTEMKMYKWDNSRLRLKE